MLKLLFDWLDSHPSSYWLIVTGPTLLFLGWTAWPARVECQGSSASARENRGWSALLLFAFLLAWRWPWLLYAYQYSPDESQHVAGILTLVKDPVFFRSVDGSTAGPLNFYLPIPITLLLGKIDFFTVRLAGLLMVWGILYLSYRTAAKLVGVTFARLGLIPAALFFATTTDWEFLHYSTEHAPVLLFSVCLWALVTARQSGRPLPWLIIAGLAAGLSPWAKLQIGPMSAGLIIWGLWEISCSAESRSNKIRRALALSISTLIPTIIGVLMLYPFDLVETAFQRYVFQNVAYVDEGVQSSNTILALSKLAWGSRWFPIFALGPVLAAATVLPFAIGRRRWISTNYLVGAALTVISLACVILPGRPFQHYLLLPIIPLTIWGMVASRELFLCLQGNRARQIFLLGLLILGILPLSIVRLSQPVPSMFGQFAENWKHPRSEVNDLIYRFSLPGDRLALWGYAPILYAATGLAQGTRDSYSYWSIAPSKWREIYRRTYLADIKQNQPAIFVDSVGPGSNYYPDPKVHGHATFPALANYIAKHYTHVTTRLNFNVYVRNDLFEIRMQENADFRAAFQRSQQPNITSVSPEKLLTQNAQYERLGRRAIILLAAPASLTSELSGNERELFLDYGFHPRAIAAHASDGATLRVEIISPNNPPQPVFSHFVDPGANPGKPASYSVTIPLPPFPPNSQLVVSSDAGPKGNRAWDWLYLSGLQFHRNPQFLASQFPHYNRIPEYVSASTSYRFGNPGSQILMQHAPAQNVFRLTGNERLISFAFGFNEGAYSGNSRTDGAIFRVERHREQAEPQVLFERRLDPLANPDDRGRQVCVLELSNINQGDLLTIAIDPGSNAAWDWTYLTDVDLR